MAAAASSTTALPPPAPGSNPKAAKNAGPVVAAATATHAGAKTPASALGVSASVGHDHWANDVLSVVPTPVNESSDDKSSVDDPADLVARKVLEKKRKFHAGRLLELKNLPDGCSEQVRQEKTFYILVSFSSSLAPGKMHFLAGVKLLV